MKFLTTSKVLKAAAIAGALFTFAGCSSIIPPPTADTTRFYVFAAVPCEAGKPLLKEIGLRPIELPGYLRTTKSLVVRKGENEVLYADGHRWAEPLDSGLIHAIKDRLCSKLGPGTVVTTPYPSDLKRDFEVSLRIIQCEGDADGHARFSAVYQISSGDGSGRVIAGKRFDAPALDWDGKDYGALVKALSEGVAKLADAIGEDME